MIVRPAGTGCVLITQPDHAHMARRIMEHCVSLVENPRRDVILLAIGEHDAGWAEVDASPTIDATGAVVDFINAPVGVRQGVWPRTVAGLSAEPYAAALVAEHAIFAYSRFREHAVWAAFFDRMEALREEMLRRADQSPATLTADYAFLRLGDLISLAFCTGSTAEQQFRDWTVQLSGPRVRVTPGIFGGSPVTFAVAARAVRPPFASNSALHDAISRSATTLIQGEAA